MKQIPITKTNGQEDIAISQNSSVEYATKMVTAPATTLKLV
jgi:hypothetical protein